MTPQRVLSLFIHGHWEDIEKYANVSFPNIRGKKRKDMVYALQLALLQASQQNQLKEEATTYEPSTKLISRPGTLDPGGR